MTLASQKAAARSRWPDYRAVWRWHFYAGLFCLPFVCWLACTGAIYLFKPQVEGWLDRPYAHLVAAGTARAPPSAEVRAALAAEPGTVLHAYQLPTARDAAAEVLVGRGVQQWRVWVHPATLKVLKTVREDDRLMKVVFRLHGELLLGDWGSRLVELAASWAVVMILTGLYLWWPRQARGLRGVLLPRLSAGRRLFWRDLHACAGAWVSVLALLLLLSGLPWATSWGGYLQAVRHLAGQATARQDWTTGRSSELARRTALSAASLAGPQAASMDQGGMAGMAMREAAPPPTAYAAIDRVTPGVDALHLAYPVLVSPPLRPSGPWGARSDAQDRPKRVTLWIDGASGRVLRREDFGQRDWVDQAVGVGVAAHEGQLFGWPNQLLGLFGAASLVIVSVSAAVLWWRRGPQGLLRAPPALAQPRACPPLLAALAALGVLLPLFGASLLAVLAADRLVFRRLAEKA